MSFRITPCTFARVVICIGQIRLREFKCLKLFFSLHNCVLANTRWSKTVCRFKMAGKHVAKITLYTIICHKELTCFRFLTISVPGYFRCADLWRLSLLLPPNIDVRTGMFWKNVIKSSLYIKDWKRTYLWYTFGWIPIC